LFRHAEDVRWSPFRRRRGPLPFPYPSPGVAMVLFMVEIILLFGFGANATSLGVEKTILYSQLLIILLPPAYIIYRGGYDRKRVFSLIKPNAMVYPAALILACGAWLAAIELGTLQNMIFPFPDELLKQFTEFFKSLNSMPLSQVLIYIAILPGICEELLCRGFLLNCFLPRFGKAGAVVVVAVAFGILHLDPYRFLSTSFLGLILGFIAVESGSVFPAMLAHATNNALSYIVQQHSEWFDKQDWLDLEKANHLPWYVMLGSAALLVVGYIWMTNVGTRRNPLSPDSPQNPAS
jgi:sodium transport system permease protein